MSHLAPPLTLEAIRFLVGHFHGEGRFEDGEITYEKEVIGRWEAGGHFLALSMKASYRENDAVADVHEAMAVVGIGRKGGALEAHVFTDGGLVFEHELELGADRVTFRDRVPHETRAREARKILVPQPYGYEELLELDRGGSRFEPYQVVRLRRV